MNAIIIDKRQSEIDARSCVLEKGRRMPNRFQSAGTAVLIGCALFFATQHSSFAQASNVDRAQILQSETQPGVGANGTPEGIQDGHAATSPNDADLGEQQILKRVEEYKPFTIMVSTPVFYTSNVALTNRGEVSDVVAAPLAAFYYQPRLTPTLYGLIDVRQQLFYYGTYHSFDFGSMDVEAGLSYYLPQFHNLVLRGEYDFNRLTMCDRNFDEFFSNQGIIFNAEVPFRFGRAQLLALGTDANISAGADHQSPRRNDYEGYANYSVHLARAFSIDSSGRIVVRDYHQNDRTDVSEILSVSANYQLTNWWTVSAISSFAHSDSNQDVFDYNVANLGGGITLTVKF